MLKVATANMILYSTQAQALNMIVATWMNSARPRSVAGAKMSAKRKAAV